MNDLYNNEDFDLFKYQMDYEQKIFILYILKDFPQEIKDQICVAIDLAIDKYLLGITFEENFYLSENNYVWDITMEVSSSETYTQNNKHFYKNLQEFKLYSDSEMDVNQLAYFKHLPDETKLLIFNILKELPTDVHLTILTPLNQHEEWKIMEAIEAESNYEYSSSECSDPEEEYERRLIKQFSSNWWDHHYSGNETD